MCDAYMGCAVLVFGHVVVVRCTLLVYVHARGWLVCIGLCTRIDYFSVGF